MRSNWTLLTVLALLVVGLGSGCGEFLTVEPQDDLSRTELFTTVRGANAAVIGLYHQLGDASYYQYRMPVLADLPGNARPANDQDQLASGSQGNRRWFNELHARQLTPELLGTNLSALYQDAYSLLFQANDIIAAVPELTDGSPEQLASLVAEARALRAFVHFDLVRLFAQAPGFSTNADHPGVVVLDGLPGIFDFPIRSRVQDVYEFIIDDLQTALADLDPTYSRRSADNYWLTPTVVEGLLARVHAYAGNWEACRNHADRCLAGADNELTPATAYVNGWRQGNLAETVWELDLQRLLFNEEDGEVILQSPARILGANNPEPYLQVSNDLMELYAPNDIRLELFEENEAGDVLSSKWPFDTAFLRNPPMLRLSEIYLLRAEANVELGNLAEAGADYELIRQRAVATRPAIPGEQAALRQAIRDERRRELAFEGHHFFDLSRWGEDLVRTDCNTAVVVECTLTYPDFRYALPIPFDALLRNPNLTQNPGY